MSDDVIAYLVTSLWWSLVGGILGAILCHLISLAHRPPHHHSKGHQT